MTILVTADLQLTDNPRDAYRFAFFPRLRSIIKREKVELCLILGDLTEEKDRHPATLVNHLIDELVAIAKLCPVVVVRGNHDYLDPDCPFFGFVEWVSGVTWINTPTSGSGVASVTLAKLGNVLLLPNTHDYKRDWADIDLKGAKWIFTHNTFDGALTENGQVLTGIPPSAMPKGGTTISGDIHVPQRIGNHIHYVGAPYLVDFGDNFEPRVLIITRNEMRSIKVQGPQKRLVEIASMRDLERVKLTQGDVVKVRFSLDPEDHARWPQMQADIRAWGDEQGVHVHVVQPVMQGADKRARPRMKRYASRSDAQIMEAYAKVRGLDQPTIKAGLALLDQS